MTEYHNCIVEGQVKTLNKFLNLVMSKVQDFENLEEDMLDNEDEDVVTIELQFTCRELPENIFLNFSKKGFYFNGVRKMEGLDEYYTLYQFKNGTFQELSF